MARPGVAGIAPVVVLAWLAMLGADLLLNAALFARLYLDGGNGFLLPPTELFRRIPLGYLAFLVLAALTGWLARGLRVQGWREGLGFGLALGVPFALAWSLSLLSLATLSVEQALIFGTVLLVLVAIAGVVVGIGLGRAKLRGLTLGVIAFDVACLVLVVLLQSFGVVPVLRG